MLENEWYGGGKNLKEGRQQKQQQQVTEMQKLALRGIGNKIKMIKFDFRDENKKKGKELEGDEIEN